MTTESRAGLQLEFLGAAGTVTGSKYLLSLGGRRILVDCGLFQGYKSQRLKNWDRPAFDPAGLDAVVLTHAHLDHSGYLPLLVRQGYRGKVYCSAATRALCGLLLPDSGHLQEEDARYANRKGYSRHQPALPLYTQADAEAALGHLQPIEALETHALPGGFALTLRPAGHLLGAMSATIEANGVRIVFSGDVGRPNDPIMRAPAPVDDADYIVVESTYGDRTHPPRDVEAELAPLLAKAAARGGVVVVPAFAVGRAQVLLLEIARLKARGAIPQALPIFLNSPMAVDATRLYHDFRAEHRLSDSECHAMCHAATLINSVEESIALNLRRGPMVIISASGMATGGRVVHHLKAFAPDPRNLILLAGYQAGGTRGAALLAGATTLRIHGADVPVRAEVAQLGGASAHADSNELVAWLRTAPRAPRKVFVTHGEPAAADALRGRIAHELGWDAQVPDYRDRVTLENAGG